MTHQLQPEEASLQCLEVFSKISNEKRKRPWVRKISHNKQTREKISMKNAGLNRLKNQNKLKKMNLLSEREQHIRTDHAINNDSVIDSSNKQICMLREEIEKMKDQISVMQNNFNNEIEFFYREELSRLLTLYQLIKTKQYQRIQRYLKKELELFSRQFSARIHNADLNLKPVLSKDILAQSLIEEDPNFKKLLSNLSDNIKDVGIKKIDIIPQIYKLSNEVSLSAKKLSWYFQQVPFEISNKKERNQLTNQILGQLGYKSGSQIVKLIQKNIDKTNLTLVQKKSQLSTGVKSQIGQIIQGYKIS